MLDTADFIALAVALVVGVALWWFWPRTASKQGDSRRETGFTTAELEERFGKIEAQHKTLVRLVEDLDESTGRRLNRLQARLNPKRDPEVEGDDGEPVPLADPRQVPLPLTAPAPTPRFRRIGPAGPNTRRG